MTRLTLSFLLLLLAPAIFAQDYLNDIQDRILDARSISFRTGENRIRPIIKELQAGAEENASMINAYWTGFALYQEAIFLMSRDEATSKNNLSQAISLLESQKDQDSEVMALLGSAYSLSINFEPSMTISYSNKAGRYYDRAIKKDPDNLRAYLGLGRSDYYTPKEYGGGLEVEKYLTKAISLKDQSATYDHAPNWGKDEAYWYLVQYYYREGHEDNARLYCKQGLRKFPDHFGLNELMNQMGGK